MNDKNFFVIMKLNIVNFAGVTVCATVRMVTANSARMAGLKKQEVIYENFIWRGYVI